MIIVRGGAHERKRNGKEAVSLIKNITVMVTVDWSPKYSALIAWSVKTYVTNELHA